MRCSLDHAIFRTAECCNGNFPNTCTFRAQPPPFYGLPSLHNALLKVRRIFCPTLYFGTTAALSNLITSFRTKLITAVVVNFFRNGDVFADEPKDDKKRKVMEVMGELGREMRIAAV